MVDDVVALDSSEVEEADSGAAQFFTVADRDFGGYEGDPLAGAGWWDKDKVLDASAAGEDWEVFDDEPMAVLPRGVMFDSVVPNSSVFQNLVPSRLTAPSANAPGIEKLAHLLAAAAATEEDAQSPYFREAAGPADAADIAARLEPKGQTPQLAEQGGLNGGGQEPKRRRKIDTHMRGRRPPSGAGARGASMSSAAERASATTGGDRGAVASAQRVQRSPVASARASLAVRDVGVRVSPPALDSGVRASPPARDAVARAAPTLARDAGARTPTPARSS